MTPNPPHGSRRLPPRSLRVLARVRVVAARVGEVLPYEDSELIAEVVELLGFVKPPAPDAKHVVSSVASGCGLRLRPLVRAVLQERGKGVRGNPVRSFGEQIVTVHTELESLSAPVGIGFTNQLDRAK